MNDHNTISSGNIIQLKSGGPLMTIQTINDTTASCCWFKDGEIKTHTFFKEALRKGKN